MLYRCLVIFIFTVFYFNISCSAQTGVIESIKKKMQLVKTPGEKLSVIFSLCGQGYSPHPDSLMVYATMGRAIAEQTGNLNDKVKAMYFESFALTNKGLIDSSLNIANQCIAVLSGPINDPVLLANVYNQKGRCFMRMNKYKEAIEMGYNVINGGEKASDTLLQMKGKTLIGWAYLEMGQSKDALTWHLKALQTAKSPAMLEQYGILFANLALNYSVLGKLDSSLYFIDRAISYSEKNENLFALSNSLAIQAQLFVRAGKSNLAEAPLKKMVSIRKLIGDPFYIISDMSQLSLYYAHNGQPEKGIALCFEGIAIARKFGMDTKLFFLYGSLAENYKVQGNTKKYAEVLETIIALKDSVYQTNSAEALAEMQTRYELQKKENLIILQKLDISRKNYLLYGSLLFLFFASLLAWILFRGYRNNQQVRMGKMQEEEKQLAAHAIISAEENERKRIAADLHDNIGAYATAISANVDDLMMADRSVDKTILLTMKNNAGEIMSNLRDTIWILNKDYILLTSISDRFKTYTQKFSDSYPGIEIEIQEKIIDNLSLSPQIALNTIRIMQEAFHNAVKHSKATKITIEIISNGGLKILVKDNGKGINLDEDFHGNGVPGMQQRAKRNGWQLLISTIEPTGTMVALIS